jgi:YD repeat-containing protein
VGSKAADSAGRGRWLIVFTVVLLVSSAVPVLAAEPSGPASAENAPQPEASEAELQLLPDAEDVRQGLEMAEAEEAERERWLASAEAVRQREESRYAYSGLSAADAEELLTTVFAEQLAKLNDDPARWLSDASIVRPLGEFAALVSEGGDTSLLEAGMPVRAEDEDGELRKVDLALEETPEGFRPENPIADLEIPDAADEPIEIGERGLAVSAIGADGDREAQLLGDKNVLYHEAQGPGADSDRIVSPTGGGVEIFDLLRSADSPEVMRYEIEMPAGAALRSDGNRGAEVAIGEEVLAWIPFPVAFDAQGTQVPVELEIEGNAIALHVAHQKMDLAYPILLDPHIWEDWVNQNWFSGQNTYALDIGAWQYNENWSWIEGETHCINTSKGCPWGWRGLHVSMPGGVHGANENGQWFYAAPTPYSYLVNAWIIPFWREDNNCSKGQYPTPYDYVGMWNNQGYWNRFLWNEAAKVGSVDIQSAGETFVLGLSTAGGSWAPCWRDLAAGGVAIWLDDSQYPSINSVTGIPSGWVSDATPITVTANARDAGLGIRKVTIHPQDRLPIEHVSSCTGLAGNRCPTEYPYKKEFTGDSLEQGVRFLRVSAEDPVNKGSATYETYTKVDRTPPVVTLSGQLAAETNETGSAEVPAGTGDELTLPVYNLKIEAKDGDNAEDKDKRSGVKDIEVFLDGKEQEVPWQPQSCPNSSCPMTQTYQLKLADLTAAGKHTLEVNVSDQVGKVRERNIEFEYFPATGMKDEYAMHYFPLPDGQGNEAEEEHPARPELAVNVMNGNLVYRERDIDVEGPAVDLEVERYYNSQLPDSESTEWGDGWTLAQTPKLEPEEAPPSSATMLASSGAVEKGIELPAEVGEGTFNPALRATVTKKPGGGYEIAKVTGETDTALVFDQNGKVIELSTPGYAKVDYDYENGALAEIAVDDPGSAGSPTEPVEEPPAEEPSGPPAYSDILYADSVGSNGAANGQLKSPGDVAIDAQGNVWVADRENHRIQKLSSNGDYLAQFGTLGAGDGQLRFPASLAIDANGDIWVADRGNRRIQKFSSSGQYLAKFGSKGTGVGQFGGSIFLGLGPEGIAIDGSGNIWVADTYNGRVQKFNSSGEFLQVVGSKGSSPGQFGKPTGVDVGPDGKAWVTDWENNRVSVFGETGEFLFQFGSEGSGEGQFNRPDAIDVDTKGNVWVGDQNNSRVQRFDQEGDYVDQFGSNGSGEGQFSFGYPMGIAANEAGSVWVTDVNNHRLQRWVAGSYVPNEAEELEPDDPAVEVNVSGGLVTTVVGARVGTHSYEREGDRLTAHDGPQGETTYKYDGVGRMTEVVLPNGTKGTIAYHPDGRVKSVTVDPAGQGPAKTTDFAYSDEPRRTIVTPPDAPHVTYDISDDGSVFKWWNAQEPPIFDDLGGTLYDNKEKPGAIWAGDHTLVTQAYSPQGIASIKVIANGNQLVDEKVCEKENPEIECVEFINEWVTATELHAPGRLNLEVVITDRLDHSASERFWVDIPPPPPPPAPGTQVPPKFRDVAKFREEYGLEVVFPVKDELELNARIFNTIGAWHNPQTPEGEIARASMERWGVPLRWEDVAELEFRENYMRQASTAIPQWTNENGASSVYSGYYVSHRLGGLVYLGFTSDQAGRLSSLKQTEGLMAPERLRSFPTPPSHSLTELESLQVSASEAIAPLEPSLVTTIKIDIENNRVKVGASDESQVSAFLQGHFGQAPISAYYDADPPQLSSRIRQYGPVKAGDRIRIEPRSGECTGAFGAWDQGGVQPDGMPLFRHFLLTAGHCVKGTGEEIKQWEVTNSVPSELVWEKRLGYARRWSFNEHSSGFGTDGTAVRLISPEVVPRLIYYSADRSIRVQGATTPTEGMVVCVSGSSTDQSRCGEVLWPPELFRYPPKPGLTDKYSPFLWQVPFKVDTEGGDSGAPVWERGTGKAVGTLSGGGLGAYAWLTPVLPLPGRPAAPGLLNALGSPDGPLHLVQWHP